jgi:hypothetical protein
MEDVVVSGLSLLLLVRRTGLASLLVLRVVIYDVLFFVHLQDDARWLNHLALSLVDSCELSIRVMLAVLLFLILLILIYLIR